MRYSPVFVEQIVQFAFSNVEREIADENGRHDVVVVDVDDAELPMGFARLFIQKRRQQYVHQHRQKQDPPPRRRPLCEKGLSQSMCVLCVLCDDDVVISLSFRSNVFYTILVQKFLKKDQTHHDENKGSRENTNKTTLKEDKHHHYKYYYVLVVRTNNNKQTRNDESTPENTTPKEGNGVCTGVRVFEASGRSTEETENNAFDDDARRSC